MASQHSLGKLSCHSKIGASNRVAAKLGQAIVSQKVWIMTFCGSTIGAKNILDAGHNVQVGVLERHTLWKTDKTVIKKHPPPYVNPRLLPEGLD